MNPWLLLWTFLSCVLCPGSQISLRQYFFYLRELITIPRRFTDDEALPSECLIQRDMRSFWEFTFLRNSPVMLKLLARNRDRTLRATALSCWQGFWGDQGACIYSALLINAKLLSKVVSLHFHQQCMSVPLFCGTRTSTCYCQTSVFAKSGGVQVVSHCNLFCSSLIPMNLSTDWPFGFIFCVWSLYSSHLPPFWWVTCLFLTGRSVTFIEKTTVKFSLINA